MSKSKQDPLHRDFYTRYVRFSELLHNAWIDFVVQEEVVKIVEAKCTSEAFRVEILQTITSPVNAGKRSPTNIRGENLLGIERRAFKHDKPVSVLLSALGLFEALMSDVAKLAYLSNPIRFLGKESKGAGGLELVGERENEKLLNILLASLTREDAIEAYVEEYLRGKFYGNPSDLFNKNVLGFDLHKSIAVTCKVELDLFKEITARRNIIVHNRGRVDKKYVREVPGTPFKPAESVNVDSAYLFACLKVLDVLAVNYVNSVSMATVQKPLPPARTAHIKPTLKKAIS